MEQELAKKLDDIIKQLLELRGEFESEEESEEPQEMPKGSLLSRTR